MLAGASPRLHDGDVRPAALRHRSDWRPGERTSGDFLTAQQLSAQALAGLQQRQSRRYGVHGGEEVADYISDSRRDEDHVRS